MVKDADENEIKAFLQEALTYEIPEDLHNANAVLNISSEANEDTFARLRRDEEMGDAMRRVMKDDLEKERTETLVQAILNLMKNLQMTIDQAMDALSIPQNQRARYTGLVNAK